MAYGVQTSGSDWIDWRVREIETGKDLPDKIEWSKFSGASWSKDSKGFFYSRFDAGDEKTRLQTANYFQKVYYHTLGKPQSDDILVYERKDQKEWGFGAQVTDDGKYLIIHVTQGTSPKNRLFYRELKAGPEGGPVVELLKEGEARYDFIGNDGAIFYFRTDKDAPRRRLIAIDTAKPGDAPKEIVGAIRRGDGLGRLRGRPFHLLLFAGRQDAGAHFRSHGQKSRRSAAARHRHRDGISAASPTIPKRSTRSRASHARRHLPLRRGDRRKQSRLPTEGRLQPRRLHD